MTEDDFRKLCNTFGFAPSRALREMLDAATKQAVLAEREACAKECEELRPSKPEYDQRFYDGCTFSAYAIRARKEKT